MQQPDYSISTPENVDLHLEIAGLGNRLLAQIIDNIIMLAISLIFILAGVLIAVGIASTDLDGKTKSIGFAVIIMVIVLFLFILQNGYFLVFEGLWRGQTPGKRQAEIRVIEQNGQPIGWPAAIIRNLMRLIDGVMFLGILVVLTDKNERRLGDMAAGTIVIRERKTEISTAQLKMHTTAKADTSLDVGRVTPAEYDLLVDFLRRREALAKSHRPGVAQKLAVFFKNKLDDATVDLGGEGAAGAVAAAGATATAEAANKAEEYLERIYLTYHQRALD